MPPIIGWAVTTAQIALRHVKMDSDYSVPAVITSQDLCEFILKNTLEEGTCGIVIRPLDLVLGTYICPLYLLLTCVLYEYTQVKEFDGELNEGRN